MDQSPHPLLLPGIVEEIFDYLSPDEIKPCRHVCKTWRTEGATILRKRNCKIYLSTPDIVKSLLRNADIKGNLSVKIGSNFGRKNPLIHSFFRKLGKLVVSLELCHPSWTGFVSLRKFLAENIPNTETLILHLSPPEFGYGHIPTWNSQNPAHELYSLKKVKHLRFSIDYTKYWSYVEQESIKPFLRHLLSGMPNLEVISSPKYPENFIETFQYEVQILFRESPNLRPLLSLLMESSGPYLPKLKHLDVPLKYWTVMPSLQERKYPLELLDWFVGLDVTGQEIRNFLTGIMETLKSLSMDFTTAGKFLREVNYEPCNSFNFHDFNKLESLTLRSFKGSVKLILGIPNLKHLTLTKARNLQYSFDEINFHNTVRYSSLVTLTVDQHNPKDAVDAATLERIGNAFPNLTRLDLRFLTDEALRSIFVNFPCLVEVVAMDGIFHDEGVTGISPEKLSMSYPNKCGVPARTIKKCREYPYIGDLKNLRKLSLGSKHLTGRSAFFGFLDCKNLTSLTIMGYGFSNLSLCAISDELNLSYFKTIYCTRLTIDGAKYVRKRMNRCELHLNELQPPLNGLDIYRLGLFQSGTVPVRKRPIATSDMDERTQKRRRKCSSRV